MAGERGVVIAIPSVAGYSGTPLFKKIGIKEGHRVMLIAAPENYTHVLSPLPPAVQFVHCAAPTVDIVQVFATKREELAKHLSTLRKQLKPNAAVWVSWPMKVSKVPTTVSEDIVRELALPLGFVDIKVCGVNDVWSQACCSQRASLDLGSVIRQD